MNKKFSHEHRKTQSFERKKAMHHREKPFKNPKQYMLFMMNGVNWLGQASDKYESVGVDKV